jgi:hypothetical protein
MDLISEIKLWCLVRLTLGLIAVLIEVPVMAIVMIVNEDSGLLGFYAA